VWDPRVCIDFDILQGIVTTWYFTSLFFGICLNRGPEWCVAALEVISPSRAHLGLISCYSLTGSQQVVMDSVAFQFRTDFKDYAMRSRLLTASAQRLTQLAIERKIAGMMSPSFLRRVLSGR